MNRPLYGRMGGRSARLVAGTKVNDTMKEQIQLNYERIKQEALQIVSDEKQRIKNDPKLQHLIKEEQK